MRGSVGLKEVAIMSTELKSECKVHTRCFLSGQVTKKSSSSFCALEVVLSGFCVSRPAPMG